MSSAAAINPFPGLRPFRQGEEHLFFGREATVDAMIDKLAARRFLAVLGTSGSGKSSLINSGLCPALHRGLMARAGTAWRIATFRPGGDPIAALARALAKERVLFAATTAAEAAGADAISLEQIVETTLRMSRRGLLDIALQARLDEGVNLLVVVDQFEELFRYRKLAPAASRAARGGAVDDATAFVNLLLQVREQLALPIYVVLTMRSDFLGDCTAFPGLAQAINDGQYLVPRMTRDERRAAIAGPAGVAGGTIGAVLLTRLVNDVGEDPDQLSILQHALNRTWARWQAETGGSGAIELRHYEAIGTMAHALDRHAEAAWAQLHDERERCVCERLFKALTDQATDPRGVRRPVRLATLCTVAAAQPDELRAVIEVFREPSRSFLMPAAPEPLGTETVIDISHESLMRVWERLKAWAAEEALAAQQLRRLGEAAALHAQGQSGLWRDPELHFALQWQTRQLPSPAWAAQYQADFEPALRFLGESSAARDAERAAASRRRALRRRAIGAVVVLLALVGALFFELWQRSEASLVASTAANLVLKSRPMLDGQSPTTIDVALLLGAAGYRLAATNEAFGGLQHAIGRTASLASVLSLPGPVLGFSPDQRTAVTLHGSVLRLWDAATGAARGAPLKGHLAVVNDVAFSPDGKALVTAGDDAALRLWDAATGLPRGEPWQGHTNRVWCVAFSPDGRTLASGSEDATVRLWDVASGTPRVAPLQGHGNRIWGLAFSPDGGTLASASDDGSVRLWETSTGAPRGAPLAGHVGVVSSVAFSPDGTLLASAGGDNSLRLWDAATGEPHGQPLRGHTSRIWSVAFSPEGRTLASGGEDQTVRLWDAQTGEPRGPPLLGHKNRVWRVAFSADGAKVLSGSNDRTLIRWDAQPSGDLPLTGHHGAVRSVAVSPDGTTLVSGGDDATVRVWDAASRSPRGAPLLGHGASVSGVAFSPDGKLIASASEDGMLRRWNLATGQPYGAPLDAHAGPVWSVAFSPDGKTLAAGGGDAAVRLWNAASGQPHAAPLRGHSRPVWSVAFSPDGKALASGSDDATVRLWDSRSGEPRGGTLRAHSERVWSVAFDPDGKTVASASEDGIVRRWDVATGLPLGEPLLRHSTALTALAYSPDGETLAAGGDDSTLRLFDPQRGEARGVPLSGHVAPVTGIAFSRDGRYLVSSAEDGSLRVWDAPNAWIDRVCAKLTRNLSRAEWKKYAGDIAYVIQCPGLPVPAD